MPDGSSLPRWPRCMRAETAAEYLDVSKTHFLTAIARDLQAINLNGRAKGWLKEDLDAWLERKAGRVPALVEANPWH